MNPFNRIKPVKLAAAGVALAIVTAIAVIAAVEDEQAGKAATSHALEALKPAHARLASTPGAFIGVYLPGVPASATPATSFQTTIGAKLRMVMYYSGWGEPFQASFSAAIDRHGIIPLIQMQPSTVSLAQIADGSQDGYLVSYADAVRLYGRAVILSFGHEMNGDWYSWGYQHASPSEFIAAWRHIVTVFHSQGADNVTWLWTVNSLAGGGTRIANPDAWWPGSKYVTWAGVDGYYYRRNETFKTLFGPTVADIRKVTREPILIAETGVAPQANKAAKIANLFAGMKANHLLGLVWFDAYGNRDWRLDTPAAIAAFRAAADQSP
jgi:mannan endo-1,4-beta-mannosidase